MWKRLKTKVLLKPPGSATRTTLLHHDEATEEQSSSSSLTDHHHQLLDPGDPDLIKDSRKMSFPYLDKCSCGSPGLNVKDVGSGVRRTGSLRRKNNIITEINRKNDGSGGGGRGKDGKESCETARNEYTKPESLLLDERRKGSAASTPVMTMPATTTMMITATTTTTTAQPAITTSAGYTPPMRAETPRVNKDCPQKEIGRKPGSTRVEDSLRREVGRRPSSVQRSSTGLDDDDDSEEDSDEDSADEDPQSSSEGGTSGRKPQRESAGSSDYTSLAFDVNYVRVSPPKMTRRQKPTVDASTKKKPSRESLLSGLRMTSTTTEVPPASASGESEMLRGSKPSPQDVERSPGEAGVVVDVTKSRVILTEKTAEKIPLRKPNETTTQTVVEKVAPVSGREAKETEYISLQDLQLQIKRPADDPTTAPGVESKHKDSGSIVTQKTSPDASSSPVADLKGGPLVDDPSAGDSVTLFQDGDSSVLEFTFTVRLENDVIRRIRPEDQSAKPDSNSGSPVVSGSVNIMKTDNSTLSGLKPVITVGLRNVMVDGGTTTGAKATDHDGCSGPRKKLTEAEPLISKHLADRPHQQSRHCVEDLSQVSKSPLHMSEGSRTIRRGYDGTLGRATSDSRGSLADGVKTVTWAFDRSHALPAKAAGSSPSYGVETSPKQQPCLDSVERSPFGRKQQTLADFISTQQTKITTVAIVHKSADFDETGDHPIGDPSSSSSSSSMSRAPDRKQASNGSASSPASSAAQSNKTTPTTDGNRARAATQVVKEPELTHMSWEEVMKEAKALGIPLARPGSATRQQQQQQQHQGHQLGQGRRSSISSTTADCVQAGVDAKMTSSWVCPTCYPEATAATTTTTSRRAARDAEKAAATAKKGSPFKEKFRLQNLFCRKQKDPDPDTSGRSTTSRNNVCKAQQHHPHQHPHPPLPHHHHQQHPFSTMPPTSCGGGRTAASSIEDSCCLRCVSASKGDGGGGGGGNHRSSKTPLSPSRLQSPLRMSFFSGTTTNAKKSVNGGGAADCSATVHRNGCQWNSSPGNKPGNKSPGTAETHRENANSNSDSSTLSPRQKPGSNQDFLKSLEQLKSCGWYWGPLGFEDAEVRLSGRPDGAFLVRDSSDDRYILSLSFRSQGTTHHTRIEHFRGMFSFYAQQNIHEASTIVEFIENAMRHSQEGKCLYYLRPRSPSAAPAPVQLLYPVSRFPGSVVSLKHLAQAAVLSHLRRPDLIDRLPLSTTEKETLRRHQHSRRQRAAP